MAIISDNHFTKVTWIGFEPMTLPIKNRDAYPD
jgi:hypothetical protein